MYKNGITFPTFLFFQNDGLTISSAGSIWYLSESSIADYFDNKGFFTINFDNLIKDENYTALIKTFLFVFPYFKFSQAYKQVLTIKSDKIDLIKINELMQDNFDLKSVEDLLITIKSNKIVENFDETLFYSKLYLLLYKLYCVKLSECIKLPNNDKFDFEHDIQEYVKLEENIFTQKFTVKNFENYRSYVLNVRKALKPNSLFDVYNKLFEIYSYAEYNNTSILNFIFGCIIFDSKSTITAQNKILRELYWTIGNGRIEYLKKFIGFDDEQFVIFFSKLRRNSIKK